MVTPYQQIRNVIEKEIESGIKKYIIYPFGEFGILTKRILQETFGIYEFIIIDNTLCKYNEEIKGLDYLKEIDLSGYKILFTLGKKSKVYFETKNMLSDYMREQIVEIFPKEEGITEEKFLATKCGKYSYGPLCKHWLVESVGAFSSIASGSDVVENHAIDYISTHPFIYRDETCNAVVEPYIKFKNAKWYFEGVAPKGKVKNLRRITIGNDVWLGHNVIITNGSNIGNGAIVAAGAVVTKDVPDYAVVMGVPARVVRYRYTEEQIKALNEIKWWDWTDEEIRERYDDFFLSIEEFIEKYQNKV